MTGVVVTDRPPYPAKGRPPNATLRTSNTQLMGRWTITLFPPIGRQATEVPYLQRDAQVSPSWRTCCSTRNVMVPPPAGDLLERLHQLRLAVQSAFQNHRRVARAVLLALAAVTVLSIAVAGWFVARLRTSLPDENQIGRIGEMAQATTV